MANEDDLEALRAERDALRNAHALAVSVAEDYRREWQESDQVNERLLAEIAALQADLRHARLWAVAYRIATERGAVISGDWDAYGTASDGWHVGQEVP